MQPEEADISGAVAGEGAELCRSSDPQRWLEVHGDLMWRFALARVRDADTAEDLIQEALLGALQRRDTFRGESSERTWLLSILRNKIADWKRRRGREKAGRDRMAEAPVDVLDTMFDARGKWKINPGRWPRDFEAVLDSREFWEDFERCLSRLPTRLAEAFALREVRRQPAEVICEVLSITADNLWVRLHRARALLRKCLERHWGGRGGRR